MNSRLCLQVAAPWLAVAALTGFTSDARSDGANGQRDDLRSHLRSVVARRAASTEVGDHEMTALLAQVERNIRNTLGDSTAARSAVKAPALSPDRLPTAAELHKRIECLERRWRELDAQLRAPRITGAQLQPNQQRDQVEPTSFELSSPGHDEKLIRRAFQLLREPKSSARADELRNRLRQHVE